MIITAATTKKIIRRNEGEEEKKITIKITTTTRMNLADLGEVPGVVETTAIGEGATATTDRIEIEGITDDQMTTIPATMPRVEEIEAAIVTTVTTDVGITITIEGAMATKAGATTMTATVVVIVIVIATNVRIPITTITTEIIIEVVCLLRRLGHP